MIATPLENMFRSVREAATNAGTGFEKLRLDTIIPNKRLRRAERKNQAEQFAFEEAQLHEQLMIEQEIFERQSQEQREPQSSSDQISQSTPAGQRDAPTHLTVRTNNEVVVPELVAPVEQADKEETDEVGQRNTGPEIMAQTNNEPAQPIRLAATVKQAHKVEAIERKLSLIRQRLAAPPRKNDSGIASLRAAVAC